jgi:hypothetical protein
MHQSARQKNGIKKKRELFLSVSDATTSRRIISR